MEHTPPAREDTIRRYLQRFQELSNGVEENVHAAIREGIDVSRLDSLVELVMPSFLYPPVLAKIGEETFSSEEYSDLAGLFREEAQRFTSRTIGAIRRLEEAIEKPISGPDVQRYAQMAANYWIGVLGEVDDVGLFEEAARRVGAELQRGLEEERYIIERKH